MNQPISNVLVSAESPKVDRRYAVVLAGGSGTRLWPLSRVTFPKQLLALNGPETLIQQTVLRIQGRTNLDRVVTVTHVDHRFEVMAQLSSINRALSANILCEPVGRNTLPAISWSVARIARDVPNALVGVFSSDHVVTDEQAFLGALAIAEDAAEQGYVALLGMRPTEPATSYGYIHVGDELPGIVGACHVNRFVEKPDLKKAKSFLTDGGYLWNCGIFVFRADVFLDLLRVQQPETYTAVSRLADCGGDAPVDVYSKLPNISIDYGILERASKVAVVPVSMGWSDLGSWDAIYKQRRKDNDGNMIQGDVVSVGSSDNLLWSEHGTLAALGLKGVAVIQTRDATLVCPRDRTSDLKDLVATMRESHRTLTEMHLTVMRPWGSYTVLEDGDRYKIKRIVVNPGQKLSMQMHHHRSEHWVVIAGTARIVNGDQEVYLEENQSTYIPKTHRHRLENPGKIPLQIIEIQSGPYLEEDDIVRFDDIYGRS